MNSAIQVCHEFQEVNSNMYLKNEQQYQRIIEYFNRAFNRYVVPATAPSIAFSGSLGSLFASKSAKKQKFKNNEVLPLESLLLRIDDRNFY